MSDHAQAPVWETAVGVIPYKVTVFEMATRKRVLYLRWRKGGNWKYASLAALAAREGLSSATLYDEHGRRLAGRKLVERQKWAIAKAEDQYAKLRAGVADLPIERRAPLTLEETWTLVSDADAGKYPVDTPHRREVKRELDNAVRILGGDTPWEAIRLDQLTRLWRTRIRELVKDGETGVRGAEITVSRVLTIAGWLRDRERIAKDACIAPRSWKQELRKDWRHLTGSTRDAEPNRPRYTLDEMQRIIAASAKVDPRFELLLALGAELRLGQVIRGRRADLTQIEKPSDDGPVTVWRFRVYGSGHKGGTIVELTRGQAAALARAFAGCLKEFEDAYQAKSIDDYVLFPGGKLRGWAKDQPHVELEAHRDRKPMGADRIDDWWKDAERVAEIAYVRGRGAYGARRAAVDGAKSLNISRDALQPFGGWSDPQVPDRIYADQHLDASIAEAAEVRAKIRGEP